MISNSTNIREELACETLDILVQMSKHEAVVVVNTHLCREQVISPSRDSG